MVKTKHARKINFTERISFTFVTNLNSLPLYAKEVVGSSPAQILTDLLV
jgi:hypothetical protein